MKKEKRILARKLVLFMSAGWVSLNKFERSIARGGNSDRRGDGRVYYSTVASRGSYGAAIMLVTAVEAVRPVIGWSRSPQVEEPQSF